MKIDSIQRQFGKNVKKYRLKGGLTQEQLAEKTGIDYKYVQRIEGKTPPNATLQTLAKLAKILKIDVWKLLK